MKDAKRAFKRTAVLSLLSVLFLCTSLNVCAQQRIRYIYDEAGNRTKREIVLSSTRSMSENEEEASETYEEKLRETKVTIYPNPTKGMLWVDISGVDTFKDARISLYDLNGKLLQQWNSVSQSNAIDLSGQIPGMYLMQIAYDGKVSSWKIVKE